MISKRELKNSPVRQGESEKIAWPFTIHENWGTSPSTPVDCKVEDKDGNDVTDQVTTGSASVSGQVFTCPLIHSLVVGERYRVECQWTESGQLLEAYFEIICEE